MGFDKAGCMNNDKNKRRGVLITFEGGDGTGKSTQAKLLADHFEALGCTVLRVHEPGGTQLGESIRTLLLGREQENMTPLAELLLFEAARAQVMEESIEPALARGEIVICDRFTDSTLAYQGYGRELGADLVGSLNDLACGGRVPDRTVLLEVDRQLARARIIKRSADGKGDRMESAGVPFHERTRCGFREIAASEPERVRIVDANDTIDRVHQEVLVQISDMEIDVPVQVGSSK